MSYGRNAAAYREASILSSSPEQLVVLLYDHLLASLKRAAHEINADNIEGKAKAFERASDIVYELLASLQDGEGGDLTRRLAALYAYIIAEISTINRTLDMSRLARLTDLVQTLHQSWAAAARQLQAGESASPVHS
jgi:flagellar protein FliS